MEEWRISETWRELPRRRPLVYQITNTVAAQLQANVTLAVGGSPIMSRHPAEAGELASVADALLINVGTPTDEGILAIRAALRAFSERGKPALLDPVGYGASSFRTRLVDRLLDEFPFSVIKGNAGEIAQMAGMRGRTKGVDSLMSEGIEEAVSVLAIKSGAVVVATGKRDYLSDGRRVLALDGGSEIITSVTASGCMAGAVLASCAAVEPDALKASLAGLVAMDVAAERAAKRCDGPASFQTALIDALYLIGKNGLSLSGGRLKITGAGDLRGGV